MAYLETHSDLNEDNFQPIDESIIDEMEEHFQAIAEWEMLSGYIPMLKRPQAIFATREQREAEYRVILDDSIPF